MEKITNIFLLLLFLSALTASQNVVILNRGCKKFAPSGDCEACSIRYYRDKEGICQPVNVNCNGYSTVTGGCTSCYSGHVLIEDACLPESLFPAIVSFDPFCNKFEGNDCIKCAFGYHFDLNGRCKQNDPRCRVFDELARICTGCYSGFTLKNGGCIVAPPDPTIANCNEFSNGLCTKCSQGYYFNELRICTKIPDSCKSFDTSERLCRECYSGYELNMKNQCVKSLAPGIDPGCSSFGGNGECVKCSFGYYFNQAKRCRQIPPTCAKFDQITETCSRCFPGYALNGFGVCVQSQIDAGCNTFEGGRCIKCSSGYYFGPDGETCKEIPSTCSDFDTLFEVCMNCFQGYKLEAGICIKSQAGEEDAGCSQFRDGKCVKCSQGYYFPILLGATTIKCKLIPPTCANFDTTKQRCLQCFPGYTLSNDGTGVCSKSTPGDLDAGCSQFRDGKCVKCSQGYYFPILLGATTIKCKLIPSTCADFDTTKQRCLQCFPGYTLSNDGTGSCVVSIPRDIDGGCNQFNSEGGCIKCSFGYYFDRNRNCKLQPPSCANFNVEEEKCKSCYSGYTLNEKFVCVKAEDKEVTDSGCKKFDNVGKCLECSFGYYFGKDKKCRIIPPSCMRFDQLEEICKECYQGFALNAKSQCVVSEEAPGDPGCSKFSNGVCVACSFGYYFGKNGQCRLVPPTCARFDQKTEVCLSCYDGYSLDSNHACKKSESTGVTDPGCNEFQNGKCVKCSQGYYFGKDSKCKLVPPTCAKFDTIKEICENCYSGFSLDANNRCQKAEVAPIDPGCNQFRGNECIKCSFGYYFNKLRKCTLIPPTCATFDQTKDICIVCYPGYNPDISGVCIQNKNPIDSGCNEFANGVCVKCSVGYYFNDAKKCTQIPPNCKSFDVSARLCRQCYPGFSLNDKAVCAKKTEALIDPFCKTLQNDICIECAKGTFFNAAGRCQVQDPLCKTFDPKDGACTSCYIGYKIEAKTCVVDLAPLVDPHCKTFLNGVCTECAFRYFKGKNGQCKEIDPSCKQFTEKGECIACYVGFRVAGAVCVEDEAITGDPNCAQWQDGFCMKCSTGTYFDPAGLCKKADPLCKTFREVDGACETCFVGFKIDGRKCVVDNDFKLSDPNCASFDGNSCLKCSKGFFHEKGVCRKISDLCATYDEFKGHCLTCFTGFKLTDKGTCEQSTDDISDLNCAQFKNNVCVKCSQGFFFGKNSKCQASNPLCKFYDSTNGKCTECYIGFKLQEGNCIRDKDTTDLCAEYQNKICLRCAERAFFDDLGKCRLVDDSCRTFDIFTGECTTCYQGFVLEKDRCIKAKEGELGCAEYNDNGACVRCPTRSYLSKENQCVAVSDDCAEFDYAAKVCTGCYSGYALIDKKCEISEVEKGKQIENCYAYTQEGMCLMCFDRFYLEDNKCKEVNVFCKKYDKNNGDCTECYTRFKLNSGQCLPQ